MRKGQKASPETRARMTASQKRRWDRNYDAYLQTCVIEPHLGSKRTQETRDKMSASQVRFLAENPDFLAARTERLKRLWSQPGYALKWATRRNYVLVDQRGRLYPGIKRAALKLGVNKNAVKDAIDQEKPVAGRVLQRVITNPKEVE